MHNEATLSPLETLFEMQHGRAFRLTPKLTQLYGNLRMPEARSRQHVFSNFVSTLDGVVSLQARGHAGGGDISGFSAEDRMVMGLLRAIADVVIVGSGTLDADPRHVWTPDGICPELTHDYGRLRTALRKRATPLNVIVSGSGRLDLRLPVFTSGSVRTLVVTTTAGAKHLLKRKAPRSLEIRAIPRCRDKIPASSILGAVARMGAGKRILIEGGPRLLA
jgi:riboflavin biosynthesis pyrimidine reductase